MSRVLAIDYGVRRTGIAVTDPMQIIPNGLTTVDSRQLLHFLQDYVAREQVERIVVGRPMQTSGCESENLANVRKFVDKLKQAMPQMPVEWWDERYTSVMAHKTMLESGIGKMARRNKALVDEISACIILQGWMERRR